MNYRHVYMLIIEHAKSEQKLGLRKKGNGNYYEAHHILSFLYGKIGNQIMFF